MTDTPVCVADCKALLGEGPVWVEREQALYWLDIRGRRIFRRGFDSGLIQSWVTPLQVGSIVPREQGGFIGGTDQGLAFIEPEANRFEIFADPEEGRPDNRFNDGKVDREGRFWAGTMDAREEQASGALYRLDSALELARIDDGYRITNGPAFSLDGRRMYHNDSARQIVYQFDFDPNGEATGRKIFCRFEQGDGYPDGMTVDAEDCLWIAFWDGWCLRRYAPDGECLAQIELPIQRPTSCAFGGPALDHLFVTSASVGLDEIALGMQPYAGGLFLLRPGITGVAERLFAG